MKIIAPDKYGCYNFSFEDAGREIFFVGDEAVVVELADTADSKPAASGHKGSTPFDRTKFGDFYVE